MKCSEIIKILETLSPRSMACDWDNPGLLAGRRFISQEISATMKESTRLHRAWRSLTPDIMELNTFLQNLWRNI